MIVWQHWTVLLLVFLFPNTTILTQYNMTLTQEQISTINAANEKFKTLKNYCKENEIDLNTLLSGQEKQQMKEGLAFLKEFLPQVKSAGIVQQVAMDTENAIPKGAFLKTVKAQLDSLNQSEELIKIQALTKYSIDSKIFDAALKDIKLNTPFAKLFRSEILNGIKGAKTVADVVDVISNLIGKYGVSKFLKEHYNAKENKDYYKQEDIYIPILEGDLTRFTHRIFDCITTAIDDPTYPPNQEKAAKLAKELAEKEKELAADIAKFKQVYADWYTTSIDNVKNIDNILKEKELPRDIFILTLSQFNNVWGQAQPELMSRLNTLIHAELKEKNITIRDCADALNTALSKEDYQVSIGVNTLYLRWKKNNILPNFNALIGAAEKVAKDSLENVFVQQYINWYKEVFSMVDSVGFSTNTRFVKKGVLDSLSKCFQQNENRVCLYPIIEKYISTVSDNAPLDNYIQAWKKALNEIVIDGKVLEVQYLKLSELYGDSLNGILNKDLNLPNKDELTRAFDKSNKYIYNTPKLAKGEVVKLKAVLNDDTKLTVYVKTLIQESKGMVYALPVELSLEGVDNGKKGYSFKVGTMAPQNTVNIEDVWRTPFEFSLSFEKNKGSLSKGTEHSDTFKQEITTETSKTIGHTDTYNRTGGVSIEIMGYQIEEGDEDYNDTTVTNAFAIEFEKMDATSKSQTIEKGIVTGAINIQLMFESTSINVKDLTDDSTIEIKINTMLVTPKISKGISFKEEFETEANKVIPAKR